MRVRTEIKLKEQQNDQNQRHCTDIFGSLNHGIWLKNQWRGTAFESGRK